MTGYNGTTQTNEWSGDGLRAWKQVGSTRTYFLYDGTAPVAEYSSTGTLLATNTFGADGLVSRRANSVTTFYTFDERGSVSRRVKADGSILSSDLYDGFGTRTSTGAADVWQFEAQVGYYTDSETGLVLCTHRFYDPASGRWLTRDPMGYDGGVNLYGYVGNDPANGIDPDGTSVALPFPVIGGGLTLGDILGGLRGLGAGAVGVLGTGAALTGGLTLGGVLLLQSPAGPRDGNEWGPGKAPWQQQPPVEYRKPSDNPWVKKGLYPTPGHYDPDTHAGFPHCDWPYPAGHPEHGTNERIGTDKWQDPPVRKPLPSPPRKGKSLTTAR